MLESAYRRKKDPENVRTCLLNAAAKIIAEKGLAGMTLADVAKDAGVTKGGLFHHFENKNVLISQMFIYLLAQLDEDIENFISKDKEAIGSFTRAYIQATLSSTQSGGKVWSSLLSLQFESDLVKRWDTWYEGRLKRHAKTDSSLDLQIVRLAADGAWLALCGDQPSPSLSSITKIKKKLLQMTYSQN